MAHARTNRHMDCKAVITHATSANQATTTHCRSAANQRHTPKTAGTLLRMGKRETTMRKLIACIAIATLLAAAGCKKDRSEEHTSELQSLLRTSYDVFCFNKK